jgi:hypothetical protein
MSERLWISTVTGYRRRGTRLAEMRAVVGGSITASTIYEPLESSRADANAVEIAAALERREFDVVGVRDTREGPLLGLVHRTSLVSGVVRDHLEVIRDDHTVAESAPVSNLLSRLVSLEQVFVVVDDKLEGIITRADLNKPPIRVYLFGLVSLLEMHLSFWVRRKYPDSTWESAISDKRLAAARAALAEVERRNDSASLFSCLQFSDKCDLVTRDDAFRQAFGFASRKSAGRYLDGMEILRNRLAHSQPTLVGRMSWPEIVQLAIDTESYLHRSDEQLERLARADALEHPAIW